jgi:flagellar basal-body rod protein FlgB
METNKLKLLANAMQAYNLRSQALASNLANLDTPGYKRLSVSFEDTLQEARHTIDGMDGLSEITPQMDMEETPPVLEDELMEMADTQMRTQAVSRALREHFDALRIGITGRTG